MADTDITKMKVADLKKELKSRGLSITGNKNELSERLQAAIVDGDTALDDPVLNSDDILEDDVLNDDELDEETKSLLDSTHEDAVLDQIHEDVLKTPPDSIKSKSPDDVLLSSIDNSNLQHKKIILKRRQIIPITTTTTTADYLPKNATNEPKPKLAKLSTAIATEQSIIDNSEIVDNNMKKLNDESNDNKNVIKLSVLSVKDRLEMRAKKFGAPITNDSKKSVRAERFGLPPPAAIVIDGSTTIPIGLQKGTSANGSGNNNSTDSSVDLLKKRAERFGGSVSKIMTKIENSEKLQKRRERFSIGKGDGGIRDSGKKIGDIDDAGIDANNKKSTVDYAEKARLRLEKFKQPVK